MTRSKLYLFEALGYRTGFPNGHLVAEKPVQVSENELLSEIILQGTRGLIPAFFLRPVSGPIGVPVLYAHAHGNRYDIGKSEVIDGRPALRTPPLGLELARAGHCVLCPDMPGFGARQGEGSEAALAKAALWQGRCLLGDMLADLSATLDVFPHLVPEAEGQVACVGISMGAALAYWLAALDARILGVAHLCAFSDIAPLIGRQAHDLHGIYMSVPGLLNEMDMGDVAAMIAPRAQVVGAGLQDPLTPPEAFWPALDRVRSAYAESPNALVEVVDGSGGHAETPAMRQAIFSMLAKL